MDWLAFAKDLRKAALLIAAALFGFLTIMTGVLFAISLTGPETIGAIIERMLPGVLIVALAVAKIGVAFVAVCAAGLLLWHAIMPRLGGWLDRNVDARWLTQFAGGSAAALFVLVPAAFAWPDLLLPYGVLLWPAMGGAFIIGAVWSVIFNTWRWARGPER